jgi:hypothetical protein
MEAREAGDRQLRTWEADRLREACAAAAARLSKALGAEPAITVPDWHCHRGEWNMCWTWLLPRAGEDGSDNAGFRVVITGLECTVSTWSRYRASLTSQGLIPEEALNRLLDLAFGTSAQFRYAGSQGQ